MASIKKLNCFVTDKSNSGNPAAVIIGFKGNSWQKQNLAKQLNLPVSVFIEEKDNKTIIRPFYSETESSLCIHGTLAAASVISSDTNFVLYTRDLKPLPITKSNDVYQLSVIKQIVDYKVIINNKLLFDLFNLQEHQLDVNKAELISVGSPKIFVHVKSLEILSSLKPNFALLKQWGLDNKVNGAYIYTNETLGNSNFHARAFNPNSGQLEDAATGVAAGALASELKYDITIEQGNIMGFPSQIIVNYINDNNILVGGKVKLIDEYVI